VVVVRQPAHPAPDHQRLRGPGPHRRPSIGQYAAHEPLRSAANLRHRDLQLALRRLHLPRPGPVPGAPRIPRPLVACPPQEGGYLLLDSALQYQPGSQPAISARRSASITYRWFPPARRWRPPGPRSALSASSRRSPLCKGPLRKAMPSQFSSATRTRPAPSPGSPPPAAAWPRSGRRSPSPSPRRGRSRSQCSTPGAADAARTARPPPTAAPPLHRLVRRLTQPGRGPVAAQLSVGVEDVQLLPRVLQWRRPRCGVVGVGHQYLRPPGTPPRRPSGQPRGADFEMATAADSTLDKNTVNRARHQAHWDCLLPWQAHSRWELTGHRYCHRLESWTRSGDRLEEGLLKRDRSVRSGEPPRGAPTRAQPGKSRPSMVRKCAPGSAAPGAPRSPAPSLWSAAKSPPSHRRRQGIEHLPSVQRLPLDSTSVASRAFDQPRTTIRPRPRMDRTRRRSPRRASGRARCRPPAGCRRWAAPEQVAQGPGSTWARRAGSPRGPAARRSCPLDGGNIHRPGPRPRHAVTWRHPCRRPPHPGVAVPPPGLAHPVSGGRRLEPGGAPGLLPRCLDLDHHLRPRLRRAAVMGSAPALSHCRLWPGPGAGRDCPAQTISCCIMPTRILLRSGPRRTASQGRTTNSILAATRRGAG